MRALPSWVFLLIGFSGALLVSVLDMVWIAICGCFCGLGGGEGGGVGRPCSVVPVGAMGPSSPGNSPFWAGWPFPGCEGLVGCVQN